MPEDQPTADLEAAVAAQVTVEKPLPPIPSEVKLNLPALLLEIRDALAVHESRINAHADLLKALEDHFRNVLHVDIRSP